MRTSIKESPKLPPGPKGRGIRNLWQRIFGFHHLLEWLQREYGDVVSFKLGPVNSCALFDADHIHQALVEQRDAFPRLLRMATQSSVIPTPGLARSNDERHRRKVKFVNAVFAKERMNAYTEIMIKHIVAMLDGWRPGQRLDAKAEVTRVTTGIMTEACFGRDVEVDPSLVTKALRGVKWDWVLDYLPFTETLRKLPLPENQNSRRAFDALDEFLRETVRRAHDQSAVRTDWVSHLAHAKDPDGVGQPYGNEELRDEALDLLVGNIDPSVEAITWCLDYIARNPLVRDRLEQEADEVLSGRPVTSADYDRLPYAQAVFKESVRLAPPAYFMERNTVRDCVIGGYHIPKGTYLALVTGVVHRQERYFERPYEFLPERWLENPGPDCPEHAYLPFSYAPRMCSGWEFASIQGALLVASIAQRLRLEASSRPAKPFFVLLYGIKGPVRMTVTERKPKAR